MKRNTKKEQTARFYNTMADLGFRFDETETLRRAQITLHTWAEHECNGVIQRDDDTGKPRRYYGRNMDHSAPAPDREKGALARIAAVMSGHPELVSYHQTDPRGCALYIIRKADAAGRDISSVYNRGVAVCI